MKFEKNFVQITILFLHVERVHNVLFIAKFVLNVKVFQCMNTNNNNMKQLSMHSIKIENVMRVKQNNQCSDHAYVHMVYIL